MQGGCLVLDWVLWCWTGCSSWPSDAGRVSGVGLVANAQVAQVLLGECLVLDWVPPRPNCWSLETPGHSPTASKSDLQKITKTSTTHIFLTKSIKLNHHSNSRQNRVLWINLRLHQPTICTKNITFCIPGLTKPNPNYIKKHFSRDPKPLPASGLTKPNQNNSIESHFSLGTHILALSQPLSQASY